jgi:hypothetical protein
VRRRELLLIVFALFLITVWNAAKSEAVPVFARKYQTSCQTCHTAFPRLNPFGEAFRMNGHQWPGPIEAEQEHAKDNPVKLGAEAYKRVFPDAVWPSTLPALPPISMIASSGFTYEKGDSGSTGTFDQPTLELQATGTFGDNVSFFIAGPLFEDGSIANADLDHFFIELDNMFSSKLPDHALYLRFGKFAPELTMYQSTHDEFTLTENAFGGYSALDGGLFGEGEGKAGVGSGLAPAAALESPLASADLQVLTPRMGIQAYGLIKSRFRYVLGLQNDGSEGNTSGAKNVYTRLVYKWGGMAYDGTGGAETEHPYQEKSLAADVFAYRGKVPNDSGLGPKDLTATRVGGELDGTLGNLNLFGGYMHGRDQSVFSTNTEYRSFDIWYLEEEYVVFPWLMGVCRYEQAQAQGAPTTRRIIPNITALYRANIALRIEAPLDPDNLKLNTLLINVNYAY